MDLNPTTPPAAVHKNTAHRCFNFIFSDMPKIRFFPTRLSTNARKFNKISLLSMLASTEVDKNLLATTIKFDLLSEACAAKSSFECSVLFSASGHYY
jgi:hypothetical protein